jgi:hypothetical protein
MEIIEFSNSIQRNIKNGEKEFEYCFRYHSSINIYDFILVKNKRGEKIWLQVQFMGRMLEENKKRRYYLQYFIARVDNFCDPSLPYQYNDEIKIHYAQIEEHKTFHQLLNHFLAPEYKR